MTVTDPAPASAPGTVGSVATVGLTKSFGGVRAVDEATVTFHDGKINELIGPNGSGKTTFFNCVTGMIKPDAGTATYRGKDITGHAPHRIARAGIGRSFQLCRVFPRMTFMENMLVAVRSTSLRRQLASAHNPHELERARGLLTRVGIDHLENAEARDLSYGQQKLLELAGVLMADPDNDPARRACRRGEPGPHRPDRRAGPLPHAEGRTFLIVEHNMDLVMSLSDHVVVFDRGRQICEGPPSVVQNDPRVLEAYLGI
jgi:neutral amino acid transport system ATP-binding protein